MPKPPSKAKPTDDVKTTIKPAKKAKPTDSVKPTVEFNYKVVSHIHAGSEACKADQHHHTCAGRGSFLTCVVRHYGGRRPSYDCECFHLVRVV